MTVSDLKKDIYQQFKLAAQGKTLTITNRKGQVFQIKKVAE